MLHRCLDPLLQSIHRTRLATLFAAVATCLSGPAWSLTDLGRRFGGTIGLRHKMKRADWLLGNRHLHREARSICQALCRVTLARLREPLILIDWPGAEDIPVAAPVAGLAAGGRTQSDPVRGGACIAANAVQVFAAVSEKDQDRQIVADAAREHEKVPNAVRPGQVAIECVEDDAEGVEETTGDEPPKTCRR
jgi:hypothetical protein